MARSLDDETWGDQVKRAAGGRLATHVTRIGDLVGPVYGSRNTFGRLYDMEQPPTEQIWRERAWLLVIAADYDPAEFGLSDEDAPMMLRLTLEGFEQVIRSSR